MPHQDQLECVIHKRQRLVGCRLQVTTIEAATQVQPDPVPETRRYRRFVIRARAQQQPMHTEAALQLGCQRALLGYSQPAQRGTDIYVVITLLHATDPMSSMRPCSLAADGSGSQSDLNWTTKMNIAWAG